MRRLAIAAAAVTAILAGGAANSIGDLQSQYDSGKSAAASLRSQIAAESARIRQTAGGLQAAESRLAVLQADLDARIAQLRHVQGELLAARDRLVYLENRLQVASAALAVNLRTAYESGQPSLINVILEAHGFSDLLEKVNFMERIGHQDAMIVGATRTARAAVFREAVRLGALEQRDRTLTSDVLAQRNQVAAIRVALLSQQIAETSARAGEQAKLHTLTSRLASLRAQIFAQARQTLAQVNASIPGGIAINPGGMVQPPAGAPVQVREIIAAGNAIATLPYIWGGGHGSFQASGYDCSGSVSYVLAAAGLLSAPMVSGDFMSYGDPGPGQWVTIYSNPGHVWLEVAGWRFDTVALAEFGTRWSRGGGEFGGFVATHPPGL